MTNTNCLQGMRCPKCGSEGPVSVEISAVVLMHDDGFDNSTISDTAWELDSFCQCGQCGFTADVLAFKLGARHWDLSNGYLPSN